MVMVSRTVRLLAVLCVMCIALAGGVTDAAANSKYASIVIDVDTGQVLRQRNADKRLYPASLTKMMTLYMAFEAIERGEFSLDSRLTVSRVAANEPASKLGLRRGSTITMRDALQSCATKSANDAATVIAEAIGGSKEGFAKLMTARAKQLGMRNTRFKNPHGLTARGQLSTARDMSVLGRRLFEDFPDHYSMFSRKRFKYGGRNYRATNKLLGKYDGADGIKTGYTRASGFNLVASAEQDGRRLIGVVFGGKSSASRNRHMKKILDDGFAKLPERVVVARYDGALDTTPLPRAKPDRDAMVAEIEAESSDTTADSAVEPLIAALPTNAPVALTAMRTNTDPWAVANGLIALQRMIVPQDEAEPMGEWAVQVGAYRNLRQAEDILEKAKAMRSPQLSRAAPVVSRRNAGGRPIYRARFHGLAKGQAENACRSLSRRGIACFAVKSSISG